MSKIASKKHIIKTQMSLDLALIANFDGCSLVLSGQNILARVPTPTRGTRVNAP